jgi:hypothetical protein
MDEFGTPINYFMDSITDKQKITYDKELSEFFFRCAIPFSVLDSSAFRKFVGSLRPSYGEVMPRSSSLSNTLLDNSYERYMQQAMEMIQDSNMYSLATDGWSNIRNDHLVNFVVLIPNKKPIFFKSIDTSAHSQTAEMVAADICEVIELLGPRKLVSVVTDNASNMQGMFYKLNV